MRRADFTGADNILTVDADAETHSNPAGGVDYGWTGDWRRSEV